MGRRFQAPVLIALIAFVAVLTTLSAILAAQVRVDVRLVNVIATVTDSRGRYVPNLTLDDFILEEDGRRQHIAHFSQDQNVPVSVGILLDTSGSMDRKIRTAVEAVDRFIRRIHQDDEIFLMTFSAQPVLRQDFTDDRDKLSQALRRIHPTGGTALYDVLTEGVTKIRSGRHDKRAILLITDGQDTASGAKLAEVLEGVRRSEVLIYPIGISPLTYAKGPDRSPWAWPLPALLSGKSPAQSRRDEVDMSVLRAFAENSGGRAFLLAESLIGRGTQIEKILDTIAEELRSQYTLGYYPPQPDDGRYHSIRIRTRTGEAVRARHGYVAVSS
jgi:Ca-activated chloride channel family protein